MHAFEPTLHIDDILEASLRQELGCPMRSAASLTADNDLGMLREVRGDHREKFGVHAHLSRPRVRNHHRDVYGARRMSAGELPFRPHVDIAITRTQEL